MCKIINLISLLSIFISNSFGQQMNTGRDMFKISGKVNDSLLKTAIEYATITLVNDSTKKIINGSITDKKGGFILQNVPRGKYQVIAGFIGYANFTTIVVLERDIYLENIYLVKKSTLLSSITVNNTQRAIENRIDKLVYNVEKDITSQGGMATDALKKIPMVTVDADGNVELLGNPNVRFLINGKPSAIFGNSVADALQSIPNSQVQSIEVITSPSAKYDASGTGGIINIILKKSRVQGFNGNINLAAGTRLENGSLNINWKKNNFALNAFGSGNAQLNALTPTGFNRINSTTAGISRLLQQSNPNFNRNGYKSGIGFDWAITKWDNLTASLNRNHFANNNYGNMNQDLIQYDLPGNELSRTRSLRNFDNEFKVNDLDNSLVYKHKFNKENQELEVGFNGSFSHNNTYYNQTQLDKTTNALISGANSLNPGKENEIEFTLDYTHPVSEKISIETGIKTGFESILSNANVFTLNTSTGIYFNDLSQSYSSAYHRTVYAGYIVAAFPVLKFFEIKAGARYEYTSGKASYSNTGNVQIPDYHNLAPSFVISHTMAKKQLIKFAYTYRIERPDYRDLNPFMNLSDPHNITTGNPHLQPEIGHNAELGYNQYFDNGAYVNLVLNYQRNSPDIKSYVTFYPTYKIGDSVFNDVTVTSRANISREDRVGFNISVSLPINKKFTLRPNLMVFNRHLYDISSIPSVTNAIGFRTNINATYIFNKSFTAEIFGNYNKGTHWQGRQPDSWSYTLAARKQLFNTKGSAGVVLVNAFNKYIQQTSQQVNQNFVSNNYRNLPYRSMGISFTYRFGKLKFSKPKEGDNYLINAPGEN